MGSRKQAASVKNADARAATFVVGPPGSDSDFFDIQQALDSLPSEGGSIFLREGTYSIGVTLTLPDKPVRILGCGDASVIDLGAATIAAFTIGYNRVLSFDDIKIKGDGSVGQTAFSIANAVNAAIPMFFTRILVENIEKVFVAGASSYASVTCSHSKVTFAAQATSIFWSGGGGAVTLHNVMAQDDGSAYRGGIAGDPYVWISECNLGFIAASSVSAMYASSSTFIGSFTITSVRSQIVGCNSSAQSVTRRIDLASGATNTIIQGCKFTDWTSEAIRIAASSCIISGNQNCKITETGTPTGNVYANNLGMSGSTLIGSDCVIDGVQVGGASGVMEGTAKAKLDTTAVGNVGAGEDTLITYSLPASALMKNGSGVKIRAWGTKANNANVKTLKLYFGSTAILTTTLQTNVAGRWDIEAIVGKTGTDTQDYFSTLHEDPTHGTDTDHIEIGTSAQDDGSAIVIKCTGEATSNDDIVQEGMLVEVMN